MTYEEVIKQLIEIKDSLIFLGDAHIAIYPEDFETIAMMAERLAREARRIAEERSS